MGQPPLRYAPHFEDDKTYDQVFRNGRLKADSRHILLCYKIQFNLRKFSQEIEQKGQNKYSFIHRSRNLLWALLCQGLLNHEDIEELAEQHGTTMSVALNTRKYSADSPHRGFVYFSPI